MAKKKKRAKKKVSPLDKIRKQMDKLDALHEKETDIVSLKESELTSINF